MKSFGVLICAFKKTGGQSWCEANYEGGEKPSLESGITDTFIIKLTPCK